MTTLDDITTRIQAFLIDPSGAVYSAAVLAEAVRLALSEYSAALGADGGLAGLDGESVTRLAAADESLIVVGAAGYSALAIRAESLGRALPDDFGGSAGFSEWAQARLDEFRAVLAARALQVANSAENARLADLRSEQAAAPWGGWTGSGGIAYGSGYDQE